MTSDRELLETYLNSFPAEFAASLRKNLFGMTSDDTPDEVSNRKSCVIDQESYNQKISEILCKSMSLNSRNEACYKACIDAVNVIESQLLNGHNITATMINQYAGDSIIKKIAYFQMMCDIIWKDGDDYKFIIKEEFKHAHNKSRILRTIDRFYEIEHSKEYEAIPHCDVPSELLQVWARFGGVGSPLRIRVLKIDKSKFTISPYSI